MVPRAQELFWSANSPFGMLAFALAQYAPDLLQPNAIVVKLREIQFHANAGQRAAAYDTWPTP